MEISVTGLETDLKGTFWWTIWLVRWLTWIFRWLKNQAVQRYTTSILTFPFIMSNRNLAWLMSLGDYVQESVMTSFVHFVRSWMIPNQLSWKAFVTQLQKKISFLTENIILMVSRMEGSILGWSFLKKNLAKALTFLQRCAFQSYVLPAWRWRLQWRQNRKLGHPVI